MRHKRYLDQVGTVALGAGLGYLLLSPLPDYGHVVAWALVLAGAIARAVLLPSIRKEVS